MKLLLILLAAFGAQIVTAQDYCKDIKKEVSDNKVQIDFWSPFKIGKNPPLRVKRSISIDEDYPYDNFFTVFHVTCPLDAIYDKTAGGGQEEKAEKSLTVFFTDNTKIVDDTVEVNHDFTDDRTESTRYIFYQMTPEVAEMFASKKIAKFVIAGQERLYPEDSATAIMEYVKCIKVAK